MRAEAGPPATLEAEALILDLEDEMRALASRRLLFHSEADFQHALALSLSRRHSRLELRLEHPRDDAPGAVDIIGRLGGRQILALELKYLCGSFVSEVDGETFRLKSQAGHPFRRYDVIKDLMAMEASARAHPGSMAAVIILTNDPSYWSPTRRGDTSDTSFRFDEGQSLCGPRDWTSTTSEKLRGRRPKALDLRGSYVARWRDYSTVPGGARRARFRYLVFRAPGEAEPEGRG